MPVSSSSRRRFSEACPDANASMKPSTRLYSGRTRQTSFDASIEQPRAGGPRCDVIGLGGAAALASGLLLMTVLSADPASPAVTFEPRPGGAEQVRAVVGF